MTGRCDVHQETGVGTLGKCQLSVSSALRPGTFGLSHMLESHDTVHPPLPSVDPPALQCHLQLTALPVSTHAVCLRV